MTHMRKLMASVTLTTVMLSALAAPVAADVVSNIKTGLEAAAGPSGYKSGNNDANLTKIAGGLIKEALGLLGIVLLAILIWAGFLWMTAQGEEAKVKKAKDMIFQAVVGLVIIVAAYAIADFVLGSLSNATSSGSGGGAGGGAGAG